MFTKYMHLECFGTEEVEGIEQGITYVFPKLDGTNASVWWGETGLQAGSRNRQLRLDSDNAGFYNWAVTQSNLKDMCYNNPDLIFYGEWLVPHSLTTYREDAWRKLYIFDAWDTFSEDYLHYEQLKVILDRYSVDYLAPIAIVRNGDYETYQSLLDKNVFLIQDGKGVGEGIVVKNYGWKNKYGRTTWAKLITNSFKEQHHKAMGAPILGPDSVEEKIVEKFVTEHLINKVHAKLCSEGDGWHSKMIPQLLGRVFYDLITEEMWEILKHFKNPKIDFGFLNRLTISKIKEVRKDIFS